MMITSLKNSWNKFCMSIITANNKLSGKYLFFGKTILEIEWYWINISRESKGMMWGPILVFLKAIEIWY